MLRVPLTNRRLRLIALVYGAALFLWMRLEDNHVLPVVLFGASLTALLLAWWLMRTFGGRTLAARHLPVVGALFGAASGLGAAVLTAFLMLLKTGLHGHLFPDYPPTQLLAVLSRAPVWMLAGALAGVGLALAWSGVKS